MGRRSAAPDNLLIIVTQGSQSLTLGLTTSAASQLRTIVFNVSPRLAKPRPGPNYVRCFGASDDLLIIVTQGSQNLTLGLTTSAASQLRTIVFNGTQGSLSLALGLTTSAASQLVGESQDRRPDSNPPNTNGEREVPFTYF